MDSTVNEHAPSNAIGSMAISQERTRYKNRKMHTLLNGAQTNVRGPRPKENDPIKRQSVSRRAEQTGK